MKIPFLLPLLVLLSTGFAAPRVLGFSHIAVKASRVEASVAFYRDVLGLAEQKRYFHLNNGQPGERLMFVVMKINDDQWIEVFEKEGLDPKRPDLYQVALRVESAEAMLSNVNAEGLAGPFLLRATVGQMKNRSFSATDPAGYFTEVVEYLPEGITRNQAGRFLAPSRVPYRISGATVQTADLPASLAYYRKGFDLIDTGKTVSNVSRRIQLEGGAVVIDLVTGKDLPQKFSLLVADVDEAKRKVASALSVRKEAVPEIGRSSDGRRNLVLRDPQGVIVELVEKSSASK